MISDILTRASEQHSGAQFRRCAFQVNPHHYAETFRGQTPARDASSHADAIATRAAEMGISVLAITDHNHVGGVPTFRAAAAKHGIFVFPGFELSTSEGVHVLCIYPLDTSQDQLSRFLGQFGITTTKPSTDLADCSFLEALSTVRTQGGISIAAHVTNDSGLLTVLSGRACIRAWRSEELLAIQIPGSVADLPLNFRRIVENVDPEYKRENPVATRQALAVLNAKDIVTPEDLETPSASCWIKMSEPSIEGLRQAFLDPESRIRLSQPGPADHSEVVAIAWTGGFLDEAAIHFNSNLNVLVGGRGEGKSTIIESLRYVLDLEPIGDDAKKTHAGIVQQVLGSGTKVSALIRSHRPAVTDYIVERTVPNPPLVVDESGEVTKLNPKEILPDIEIYGQHEISELTKSSEKLTLLLSRFVDRDESVADRRLHLSQELSASRKTLLNLDERLNSIESQLEELPHLEERVARFKEVGIEERLAAQTQTVREEQFFSSLPRRTTSARQCLVTLKQIASEDDPLVADTILGDAPEASPLFSLNAAFEKLRQDLKRISTDLENRLRQFDEEVSTAKEVWERHRKEIQDEFDSILREFQGTKVDGEEFMRLKRRIEALRPLSAETEQLKSSRSEAANSRRKLLADWEDLKAQEFRRLDKATKGINKKLANRVQVRVSSAGNREPLFSLLREKVGGRLTETIAALESQDDLSLTEFVAACREGAESLEERYGITALQAKRLASAGFETLLAIEELELPSTTTIKLNTSADKDDPSWQRLDDLSTGQKATAILLLLLLDSDAPLIVDQPEDDLDNRFITEGIVPRMREEKRRRQFIFSTHNANIPVLGDAELIVGLSADGEAGRRDGGARVATEHCGSIDSRMVRELVEEILEGGKEAFERRRRKYGF